MNDEQQLWRDVQKFMNQFPGFITVAKKIGQIGDLESWQAAEQRKLDAITQEIEKHRQAIKIERDAANVEADRKLKESESKLKAHADQMQNLELAARTNYAAVQATAQKEANRVLEAANATAKEIADVMEPRKAELEKQIADLMDVMLMAKKEHESTVNALAMAKDQHSAFIKAIVGMGG